MIVHRLAVAVTPSAIETEPGQIYVENNKLFAACAQHTWIELIEIQLEGKKRLTAAEFLRGAQLAAGARLG